VLPSLTPACAFADGVLRAEGDSNTIRQQYHSDVWMFRDGRWTLLFVDDRLHKTQTLATPVVLTGADGDFVLGLEGAVGSVFASTSLSVVENPVTIGKAWAMLLERDDYDDALVINASVPVLLRAGSASVLVGASLVPWGNTAVLFGGRTSAPSGATSGTCFWSDVSFARVYASSSVATTWHTLQISGEVPLGRTFAASVVVRSTCVPLRVPWCLS
jgi:hypothetical protein